MVMSVWRMDTSDDILVKAQQFAKIHGNYFDQSRLRKVILLRTVHISSTISSPQLFRFFPRFPSSIRQEIPLLVYLDSLDCIDGRIFKVSWFLELIFILLCSTFQNGCSSWVFWVKQFEMALFRLSVIGLLFTKRWWKNIDLPFCTVPPPRPRYRFRVFFPFNTCYVRR